MSKLSIYSYIPPWGVVILHIGVGSFYTLVSLIAQHQCVKRPDPREGYNYYIVCYLGNITAEEIYVQYGQHS